MRLDGSLDTNVLLRFIMDDVPDQTQQCISLFSMPGRRYQTADAVWIEVAYALEHHYQLNRDETAAAITSVLSLDAIEANRGVIVRTCSDYRTHPQLSFVDCYLSAQASQAKAEPLYTFDQKAQRQLGNTSPLQKGGTTALPDTTVKTLLG